MKQYNANAAERVGVQDITRWERQRGESLLMKTSGFEESTDVICGDTVKPQ